MASSNDSFNPFAPGFDFLQKLSQAGGSGGAAFPSWSDWVAPTMSVEELDKRINELKTVLFWLEQNQRALAATIQAMEVQKMTLSALHTMNVPVENWASAVVNNWQQFAKAGAEHVAAAQPAPPAEAPAAAPVAPAPVEAPPAVQPEAAPAPASAKQAATDSIADPLNWWSALTQQFQHIAQQAVQDVTQHAMQHAATTQDAVVSAAQTMAQQAAPAAKRKTPAPPKRAAPAKRPVAAKTAAKTAAKRPAAKKPAARKSAR